MLWFLWTALGRKLSICEPGVNPWATSYHHLSMRTIDEEHATYSRRASGGSIPQGGEEMPPLCPAAAPLLGFRCFGEPRPKYSLWSTCLHKPEMWKKLDPLLTTAGMHQVLSPRSYGLLLQGWSPPSGCLGLIQGWRSANDCLAVEKRPETVICTRKSFLSIPIRNNTVFTHFTYISFFFLFNKNCF